MSNDSPSSDFIEYTPPIIPSGQSKGVPEEYSKESPGFSTGCSPTTPVPFTS